MKKIAVGMVIAAAVVFVFSAAPVYADSTTPPERPGRRGGSMQAGSRMMGAGGQDLEAAAEALGMTVEDLQAELADGASLHDLLEEAGVDLAAWMLENQYLNNNSVERQAQMAEQLGITVEELQAALENGSTIHDLAEEAGVELPLRGNDRMDGEAPRGAVEGDRLERAAERLGITVEELEAELEAGSNIQDLYDSAGLDFPAGGQMGAGRGNPAGR